MSRLQLILRQVRFENRIFWRNPPAAFFTFIFPLMFLVIFNALLGDEQIDVDGGTTGLSAFYIPAIAALSLIGACYTNIAMSITYSRDKGLLKRVRGTPLPAWAFLLGRILHSVFIALLLVAIVTIAGTLFYGVDAPTNTLPAFAVTFALGAFAFSSLGIAVSAAVPNAEAAPAVINASVLPLLFLSDVFIRSENTPAWVTALADFFPILHFSVALQTVFNPFERGAGFEFGHLAVVAVWGLIGVALAVRFFSWEPRR